MCNDEFQQKIEKGELYAIPKLIENAKLKTAGRRRIAQQIRLRLSMSELLYWCKFWASQEDKVSRELACALVAGCYPDYDDDVFNLLVSLADDLYWGVREEITWAFVEVMENDFEKVYPKYQKLISHPSENVRRAIVVASQRVGKSRNSNFASPLFQLLEPLLSDGNTYVKKNLGPYALGDGLIRYYPDVGFQYLHKWAKNSDAQVRWNIAMSMSSTAAFKYPENAIIILEKIAADERKYVWMAVVFALKRIADKYPSLVYKTMNCWLKESTKRIVAETILRTVHWNLN